jgi:hypothetical protein
VIQNSIWSWPLIHEDTLIVIAFIPIIAGVLGGAILAGILGYLENRYEKRILKSEEEMKRRSLKKG